MKNISITTVDSQHPLKLPTKGAERIIPSIPGLLASRPDLESTVDEVAEAVSITQAYYLGRQEAEGYWLYDLHSNVTMTAEYIMLMRFLDINDVERERKMARHILKNQRTDGTWAIHKNGIGDISTTIEAYFALKLVGHSPDEPHMRRAREFILKEGGIEASRVFTKIFLAMFGQYSWKAVPSMPAEFILMPKWFPFSAYNMSSWARASLVPLMLLMDDKTVKEIPEKYGAGELSTFEGPGIPPLVNIQFPLLSWKRFFIGVDRVLKVCESIPFRPLRKRARKALEEWTLEHQESTGDIAGIQPPMINSAFALSTLGYGLSDEPLKSGLKGLENFTVENGEELFLQSCISPIWDTALTSLAMIQSGLDPSHRSLKKSAAWLAKEQIFEKGDWSVKRPDLEPGGWAFEFVNNWYPDVDDTSVVLMFLSAYAGEETVDAANLKKGIDWVLGMQGRDGGWASFDVDNDMDIFNELPFGDLEAMIDPSTSDITGRVLEMLGKFGYTADDVRVRRAIEFLKDKQEEDGCWWGRWGVNYIYGTWSALMGLQSIGEGMDAPYIRKSVRWIKAHQNEDGGWGETCESYDDTSLRGQGESTPSQTAWAMMSLLVAGEGRSSSTLRGVRYLLERQRPDGTWDEVLYTGTGFPRHFMLRYDNYRICFPLYALGMFLGQFEE